VLRKGIILVTVFLFISGITSFSLFVSGEEGIIPDWVKNNARWWADGQIAESDFISAMEYLINQGIIQITPQITEVQATKVKLSDSDRAQSIVVFMEGEFFGKGITYYTFSEFNHLSSLINPTTIAVTTGFSGSPQLLLSGLLSNDKMELYDLAEDYINPGRPVSPFKIQVKILDGNGNLIQFWDYRECDMTDYAIFLQTDKDVYRFGEEDEEEWRERFLFICAGFGLKTTEKPSAFDPKIVR